jgi:hypothetical protein
MDKREALRSMLNNLINDKPEEASMDLHNYLTTKMRDVSGLAATPSGEAAGVADDDLGTEVDLDDESNPGN